MKESFSGYERPDGRVGIRNHVLILPTSVCASDVARMIAEQLEGTIYVDNQAGCAQVGRELE
jgi:altronate dehydratase large subunit